MPRSLFLTAALLLGNPAFAGLDVAFLIDTTGSMGGELGEAKERVRQLAEALKTQWPNERVRLGVVAFRDRGDAYVTQLSPLDENVETSFRALAALTAGGGGDGPEDVLAGLSAALKDLNWDLADDVERQVFLIGDAPPHLDYPGHVTPEELLEIARKKRVVVHALGCRSLPGDGVAFFQRIAYGTEGTYQHIGQVRAARSGLEKAMLKTLSKKVARVGQLQGAALRVEVAAMRPESEGLAVAPIAASEGVCTVRVALPEGLMLRGLPTGTLGEGELELAALVAPGNGGTWILSLGQCVAVGTRVRLFLRN